jgi:polyhydroxyalkanoate synthase
MEKAAETNGESLVKGFEHLLADLKRGQLTHVDPEAFKLGENIATTPGKVVHETPLYPADPVQSRRPQRAGSAAGDLSAVDQPVLHPRPVAAEKLYPLGGGARRNRVRRFVEIGRCQHEADVVWDDYIAAQIDAIEQVRARLGVKAVHTIGYCVAGTTLAATLAILARRGQADKVKSATFFTAQVDFSHSGELKVFIDDQQLDAIEKLSGETGLPRRALHGRDLQPAARQRPDLELCRQQLPARGRTTRRSTCSTGTATSPICRPSGT